MKTFKLIYGYEGKNNDIYSQLEVDYKGSYTKAYITIINLALNHFNNSENVNGLEVGFWIEENNHCIKHGIISRHNKENFNQGGDK